MALRDAAASLAQLRSQDEALWTAAALISVGSVEMATGSHDDGQRHLQEARELAERFGNTRLILGSLVQLGVLALIRGRPAEAHTLLDEALDLSLVLHSTRNVTLILGAYAQLCFEEGDPDRSALLMGAAEGLRRRAGLRIWPTVQRGPAELVAQVRESLGAERFDQRSAAGARLSQREAAAAVR